MDIRVQVVRETLTDGSDVYNVLVSNNLVLHAYTEQDARMLSSQIRSAINVHTTDTVHILSDRWSE